MKQLKLIIAINLLCLPIFGQGNLTADGNHIVVIENGATIFVEGSIKLEQDSEFKSNGNIRLKGNWENNSSTNAFDPAVTDGNVHLIGGNQLIQGTTETHFFNLYLYGDYLVKECLVNAIVDGRLHLNNSELQTHENRVTVTNPNSNAITFDKGYVASDLLGGYLIRNTNTTDDYYFPTGNSLIDFNKRLRPVTITPELNTASSFAVRLAPLSPNDDIGISVTNATAPYSIFNKQVELTELNPFFYHNIARTDGTPPATVSIWYEKEDGDYNTVAHWRLQEQWLDEKYTIESFSSPIVSNFPLQKASFINYDNFTHDAFVLASVFEIESLYIPNTFTPDEDSNNDVFLPIITLEEFNSYELTIFDRWGARIYISDDETEGWNGRHLGKDCPVGTYVWTLKLRPDANNANTLERIGYVNLLR
jgi:gliding motility-associated-like protein